MDENIILITTFVLSFCALNLLFYLIDKLQLIFHLKLRIYTYDLVKAIVKMYYYICYKSDQLEKNKDEMDVEEVDKTKEEIIKLSKTFFDTVKERTDENNVASKYFTKKEKIKLESMVEDVKNIVKLLN